MAKAAAAAAVANPRTTQYEFFGPPGAVAVMTGLPMVVYFLYFACPSRPHCPSGELADGFCRRCSLLDPLLPTALSDIFSTTAMAVVLGWLAFQVALQLYFPGKMVKGLPLRDGSQLEYRMNGLGVFMVTVWGVFCMQVTGVVRLQYLYEEFVPLATAAILVSFLLSAYLYARSFNEGAMLALGGNSGNAVYDFFIGRELNPRIGELDLKCHCELRPGLIGWTLLTWGMAAEQYEREGSVSVAMWLVCLNQFFYVFDSLYSESAVLSTMDLVQDGFGFMLAFGDLAWVPFTYSLQARFLVDHPQRLGPLNIALIVAANLVGYWIFRGANGIKSKFRNDPNDPSVAHITYIPTKTGSRLMTSGWWGMARHINYLGDLLMGLAWCLPCGFESPLPYFYFVYFAILLVHRERRDDHKCHSKYGADWEKYCELVPWRIVPYLY